MKSVSIRHFCLALLIVGLLYIFPIPSDAQATRTLPSVGRRIDDFNKQGDKAARDEMQREMRGRKPTKEDLRRAAQIKAETKEDLESLQDIYNAVVVRLSDRAALPDEFVSATAAKVNKHSMRLRTNLVFPKNEKQEPEEEPADLSADIRRQLKDLCTKIYDFLTSPMIENPNVLDVESAAKTKRSLDTIIEMSSRLKAN